MPPSSEAGFYDVNRGDYEGRTLLVWAAEAGHGEVVKTLSRWEEVDPDKLDRSGQTLLSYAGRGGDERVIRM